jgi:hypothetical protein
MPIVIAGVAVGMADIVIALTAALLLAIMLNMMRPTIVVGLSQIPIAGAWLAQHADVVINDVVHATSDWALSAQHALTQLITITWTAGWNWIVGVDDALFAAYNAMHRILFAAIPAAQHAAEMYAGQLYNEAANYARTLVAPLAAQIAGALSTAARYADQRAQEAMNYADSRFAQAEADAQQAATATLAAANAAVAAVENEFRGIEAGIDAQIAQAEADAVAQARDLVTAAHDELVSIDDGISNALDQLRTDVTGALDSTLAQAIAAATALALPLTAALQDIENSPCMQSCSILGALGQSLGALDGVALIALVAAAANDPSGVTDALHNDVAPIVQAAADDARAALSFVGAL